MKRKWSEKQQSGISRECLDYFGEQPVFDRLLRGFREKYASYGCFTGSVVLRRLNAEDIEALEGFLGKSCHGQKSVTVSAVRFAGALRNCRFGEISPEELLELYFGEEMLGKKEIKQAEEAERQRFWENIQMKYRGTPAEKWLEEACGRKEDGLLLEGAELVNALPYRNGERQYLAVFAAGLTGNPHAFDDGTRSGLLLEQIVSWNAEQTGLQIEKSDIFPALYRQQQYLAAGILRDDISNYTMISGVRARKPSGDFHEGTEGFFREGEGVQVSLSVIAGWESVECPENVLYVVENPSVYAILSGEWKGKRACMCMNGQPRLSSVLLLGLLAKAGVKLYYAGDFDPEGLLIAQKVRQYYKGECCYWHMSVKDYEKCISQKVISRRRLKMLERITDGELVETAAALRVKQRAGYQENLWQEYLEHR